MTNVACVLPVWMGPFTERLAAHDLTVHHLWPGRAGTEYDHLVTIAGIDLLKAIRSTGANDVVLRQVQDLPANASRAAALFQGLSELRPDVVLMAYTADVMGRAAIAAASVLKVPVLHVEHFPPSLSPGDAWFLRETPGDLVLAAGEHSRRWWAQCAPNADVRVTGLPWWDHYATTRRRQQGPGEKPVVCWIAEAGSNAEQSPLVWQFRDAPARAWRAFCTAILAVAPRDADVLVKVRQGEDEAVTRKWEEDASVLQRDYGTSVTFTDAPMAQVLPHVDLVVCQSSNAGTEALLHGVPVVSLTRPGVSLLEEVPSLSILDDHLEDRLAEKIREGLHGSEWTEQRCKEVGGYYHVNDGHALARVGQVVREVAARRAAPVREREAVLA